MHDPMAMRPFMGYNFGRYMRHWMKLGQPPHKVMGYYFNIIILLSCLISFFS